MGEDDARRGLSCRNGHRVVSGQAFCPTCGVAVASECVGGHPLEQGQRFCPRCGGPRADLGDDAPTPLDAGLTPPDGAVGDLPGASGAGGVRGRWVAMTVGQRWSVAVGVVMVISGVVVAISLLAQDADTGGSGEEFHSGRTWAAVLIAGGLVAALIGWAVFGAVEERRGRLVRSGVISGLAVVGAVVIVGALNSTSAPSTVRRSPPIATSTTRAPLTRAEICRIRVLNVLFQMLDIIAEGRNPTGAARILGTQTPEYQVYVQLFSVAIQDQVNFGTARAKENLVPAVARACEQQYP